MDSTLARAALTTIAILLMECLSGRTLALDSGALEQVAAAYETRSYILRIDLHEPATRGDSMQAPTLERGGWHHHNPEGPVLLNAGTRVTVAGVFNYSEKGLFLEVMREAPEADDDSILSRPRCRIRIVVETPPADRAGQAREAVEMIGRVLETPPIP